MKCADCRGQGCIALRGAFKCRKGDVVANVWITRRFLWARRRNDRKGAHPFLCQDRPVRDWVYRLSQTEGMAAFSVQMHLYQDFRLLKCEVVSKRFPDIVRGILLLND